MKKRIYITTIILIFVNSLIAQNQERNKILTYNILFGGVTAGVGSCINKPKTEKLHKAFIRGFSRGSLGGLVNFTGKKTASLIWKRDNLAWGWASKLIHTTGTSIIENASSHRDFMEVWHMDFMFVRLEVEDRKVSGKLSVFSLESMITYCIRHDFNFKKTLSTGFNYFDMAKIKDRNVGGLALRNSIAIYDDIDYLITHEIVHALQFEETLHFNTYLNKPLNLIENKYYNILEKYIYIDYPYDNLISKMWNINASEKKDNYFELESIYFSGN